MSNCDVFVFGRTSTIDYRWLLKPKAPLSEVFFSRVLEFFSRELGARKRLFVSERGSGYCVFSTFFLHPSARDERGRSIAFAVGITCPESFAREFNYRLPTLISDAERFEQMVSDELSTAVRVDGLIGSRTLNISVMVSNGDQERSESNSASPTFEVGGMYRAGNLSSTYGQNSPIAKPKAANVDVSLDPSAVEMMKISADLKARVDTPKSMANFDAAACGAIFDGVHPGASVPPTGQSPIEYEATSKMSQPSTSLLDQADALLGGADSKAAGIDSRISDRDAKGKISTLKQDAVNPNLGDRSSAGVERSPGLLDALGAVLGALSGTSKRGRKPD